MYKKNLKKIEGNHNSILFWLITGFVVIFLFWAPFQKALFNGFTVDFERPIYSSSLWGFIVLLLLSIFFFYKWKLQDHRDILSMIVWLLPLTYLLSKISEASHYYATNMIYIQSLYAVFFILGVYLCREALGSSILSFGIMGSGYVVVWFGVLNWVGYKTIAGNLVKWFVDLGDPSGYRDAVMSASNELRLTSTFQYANSYAAFLIAMLLGAVYLVVSRKKLLSIGINAFMLVPIIVSMLLTLSRGGLVALPIALLVILPFIRLAKQVFIFVHLAIASIFSLLILSKVTLIGEQFYLHQDLSQASTGLWIIIGASLGCTIVIGLLQHFVEPVIDRFVENKIKMRLANILLPAIILIVGALVALLLFSSTGITQLLPDYIKQRIENINFDQHSVLERGAFYNDALKLFKDYPLIGAGGGAWAALYDKYQSYPYISRQAHNFFMQYLVETGIIGILVLLGFLLYTFSLYLRYRIKSNEAGTDRHLFFIIGISLIIHSVIDFDLSFVYLGILVFLCLGAMISTATLENKNRFIKESFLPVINKWYPAVLTIFSLIMFFMTAQNLNANGLYNSSVTAIKSNKSVDQIFTPINKALDIRENHPDYSLYKISILMQAYQQTNNEQYYNQMLDVIKNLKTAEPHNRSLVEQEIQAYLIKEQLQEAHGVIESQIANYPWDITLYEKAISVDLSLSEKARVSKDTTAMNQYWNEAQQTKEKVVQKMKELEKIPKEIVQVRDFKITKNMSLDLGKMEFIRGQYASSSDYLQSYVTDQFDDETNQEIARWYLAALQKQNKNDQALYDKLVSKDPKERDEINKLVSATF